MSKLLLADVDFCASGLDRCGHSEKYGQILHFAHARNFQRASASMHPHIWYKLEAWITRYFFARNRMLTLASLRPQAPTDLTNLSNVLQKRSARRAALPNELPEPLLISVARDLRSLEVMDEESDSEQTTLAAPMMLVFSLLLGTSGQNEAQLSIGGRAMFESLRSYQWAVEREIVTRLTGLSGCDDTEVLLERLTEINSDNRPSDSTAS
ncbi:hypothetical protein [Hydrogenophaga sp. OTU3427]|uniref:hypothetical protein n=1 Tax=Hydrogenophaga sp. OTU3427 TaxID=3043856 RepID=UPI00313B1FFB